METVSVIYPGGRATFARNYLAGFDSMEALEASPVLLGIKGRGAVLEELYRQSRQEGNAKAAQGPKRTRNGK